MTSLLHGCAIGGAGAVAGRVVRVSGGWLWETYALGAHVAAGNDDQGLALGLSRRIYVFPAEVESPAEGWHAFLLPRVSLGDAVIRHTDVIGAEIRISGPEPGATLGVDRRLETRRAPGDQDTFLAVRFSPDAPSRTCVSTNMERPC